MRRVQAKQRQQDFAELFGVKDSITWDHYASADKEALNRKIEYIFPVTPEEEISKIRNNSLFSQNEKDKKIKCIRKENEQLEKLRNGVLNAVWAQRKWCDGNLLMSIIFVLCVPEKCDEEAMNGRLTPFLYKTEYSCHTVLRIRKCMYENDSTQCCMIFVDEDGRVYQNWKDYRLKNALPAGILLAPYNGVYDLDNNNTVILDVFKSPAAKISSKACQAADAGAGILGLTAAAVPAAALLLPVAAPILVASAVTGFGVGIWSVFRSGRQIHDRRIHEQSINLANSQARGAWLGIAGGVLGMGAGAAASGLSKFAASGRDVSRAIQVGVNGISVASIAVNCVGVGNSAIDIIIKINDDEKISAFDVVQLGASLFLVTHSVYNYKSANTIVQESRSTTIKGFRLGLSNRQRKIFDKMVKETVRIKGQNQGKVDIIRSLRNIPDRGQFFSDVYKINKELNQNNLRPSFKADGSISLNNDVTVDSSTLRSNLKGPTTSFLQDIAPIPPKHPEAVALPNENIVSTVFSNARLLELAFHLITRYSVLVTNDLENSLKNIYRLLKEEAADRLVQLAQDLFDKISVKIQDVIKVYIPFEKFLWDLFNITFSLSEGGDMNRIIFKITIEFIEFHVMKFYEDMFVRSIENTKKCKFCRGHYTLVELSD